jgi:hypothetical protein
MQPIYNHGALNEPTTPFPSLFGKSLGIAQKDPSAIQIGECEIKPRQEPYSDEIINFIQDYLPMCGTLVQDDRGFVYLDLVNDYIYELMPFIDTTNLSLPPYFDGLFKAGAHVSVILPEENMIKFNTEDLGREIEFFVTGCYSISPKNWLDIEKVWFLTIEAPELIEIRQKNGLTDYLFNQQFHVTISVRKRFLNIHEILQTENQKISIRDIF